MTLDTNTIHSVVVQRRKDPRQRLSRASNRNINSFIMLMNISLFSQLTYPRNAQIQCGLESDIKTSKPCSGYIPLPLQIQPPASSLCSVSHDLQDLHEYLPAPLPCGFWLANGEPGRKGSVKSVYLSPWLPPCQLDESLYVLKVSVSIRQLSSHSTLCLGVRVSGTAPSNGFCRARNGKEASLLLAHFLMQFPYTLCVDL